jgi:hypothetical protein
MINRSFPLSVALGAMLIAGTPAAAQPTTPPESLAATEPAQDPQPADTHLLKDRPVSIQYLRPVDRRGINVFETSKDPGVEYTGFKLDWARPSHHRASR